MADYNQVLTPGDWQNGIVNTVVEISQEQLSENRVAPPGSSVATFQIDRVEPSIYTKPCNYGFIPQTLDEDGDELDTLVVCDEPIPTGVWLEARIVGVLNFVDDGES